MIMNPWYEPFYTGTGWNSEKEPASEASREFFFWNMNAENQFLEHIFTLMIQSEPKGGGQVAPQGGGANP